MTYVKWYIQGISFDEIKYGIIFGVLLFALLLFLHTRKKYPFWRMMAALLLYVFLFVIFASTVLSRPDYGVYNYETELFWSYRYVIERESREMARQIFLNMLVLIPAGFLFPLAAPGASFKHTFFFGLLCSGLIEVLQLILQRGLFEWDDILHNTLGACIGYAFFMIGRFCMKKRRK